MSAARPDQDPVAESERLAALAAYDIIGVRSDDPVLDDLAGLCELAATVIGAPTAVVNLLDDRFQHQVVAFGTDPADCRRDDALCETTLAEGTDLFVPDASGDPRFAGSPWVDGRLADIRLYCAAILRTPAGQAIGTLCVFDNTPGEITPAQMRALGLLAHQVVDVLELRLRTRQLEATHAEVSRSQDRLASFAGQISHDLKAPITAILGFTELLEDMEVIADDPSAAAYVARCTSAAGRMLGMIDDLLAYARVGGTLQSTPVELDIVVPEVLADLGRAAAGATVTWEGPPIVADSVQLRALLQNLVGNSLAYRGDAPCEIRIVSRREGGDATVLQVIDNGSGIPAGRHEEVLRPLVRVRTDVSGAGLGLAVCARIAAAHGGTFGLSDTPGGGTTATVVLPD